MIRPILGLLGLLGLLVIAPGHALASPPRAAALAAKPWSHEVAGLAERAQRGHPLVVHVIIALCHNAQVHCGAHGLGNPGNPATNLYWGALFGPKRFFEKGGYETLPQERPPKGVLLRAVYRRRLEPTKWGVRSGKTLEQLVVVDAIHGAKINDAVSRFFTEASQGGNVTISDGERQRKLPVSAVGYAGHNRLMDGLQLASPAPASKRQPIPSFVLACLSERYFSRALKRAGSTPLVMTRAYIAPEGYAIEAMVRGLGDNLSQAAIRRRVVAAYAQWQRISKRTAGRLFTP